MSLTVSDWVRHAEARLVPLIGTGAAAREVRHLLAHATGWSMARVSTAGRDPLDENVREVLDALLTRRLAREPLAQILGQWAFYGRAFSTTSDTLTPRPDTETLVERALDAPFSRLLDLGTGTGVLAVTLLAERIAATALATDLSQAALDVAAGNAARHGVMERVSFLRSDWWERVTGEFDLIVSNPPYVSAAAYADLAPEVTHWEPRQALTPGGDGLDAYREIARGAARHLAPGGRLLVEIGADQGESVPALFRAAGLDGIAVNPDINGKPRVVGATVQKRHGGAEIGENRPFSAPMM